MKRLTRSANLPFYCIALGLFIILKALYPLTNSSDLLFLLYPTNFCVEAIMGSTAIWTAEGYFHPSLNIVIDKSCSGFNFWLLAFLVFTYLGLKYARKNTDRALYLATSLFFAYILSLFANSSRIFASLVAQRQTENLLVNHQALVHEAVGIVGNLSFLILTYYLMEQYFKQIKKC